MDRRLIHIKWMSAFLWIAVIVKSAVIVEAMENVTDAAELSIVDSYTASPPSWGPWGAWGACSRRCGGGLAVQTRACTNSVVEGAVAAPGSEPRPPRPPGLCVGAARRYRECNTEPCPGGGADSRAEQCAAFNRRPFRGRYYNWVPYVDGNSPCTLNCRPVGRQFYASLGRAADGTPCTIPGRRAVCLHGVCQVVGTEVLATGASVRCGRRLVSGLFSRSRLPLGYSLVGSVPRGACRLNVTELAPSDNYIALKLHNGSFVINGHFAVSAAGAYDAAGARYVYARAGGVDSVTAAGPLLHAVDIMVLYTKRSVDIRYEYYIEGSPDDEQATTPSDLADHVSSPPKHSRRHHNFRSHARIPATNDIRHQDTGSTLIEGYSDEDESVVGPKRFTWKIASYTQCTRTCGGGHQIGKYRCVETLPEREVTPTLCVSPAPSPRRRRCALVPCPPRWRAAAWSVCPPCGPATRSRLVGCVQENAKGIAKVSDSKCPAPQPDTEEKCDIPDCKEDFDANDHMFEPTAVVGNTDTFREGPVYTVSMNDTRPGPEYSFSSAGWLHTEWSECVGWCVGGGVQTRGVRCADPAGCAPRLEPESRRACAPNAGSCDVYEGRWFMGEWSKCSSACGGRQARGVLCVGGSGRHLKNSACKDAKPETERPCGDTCLPTWYYSEWSQCKGTCEQLSGEQRRTVWCARAAGGAAEHACAEPRPPALRACRLDRCAGKNDVANDVFSDSQRVARNQIIVSEEKKEEQDRTTSFIDSSECVDKLKNCALAAQARLCRYNYYNKNCCQTCRKP